MARSLVYGLGIRSNRPIPCVPIVAATARPDVRVTLGAMPAFLAAMRGSSKHWHSSANLDDRDEPTLVIDKLDGGAWFHLRYADGTEFLVDRSGTRVWATWHHPLTVEDTATYLLGPVMGFVLLLRGTHALHASAVNIDGRAIALVGPGGAGKSTTAAAFARLGYRVLAEDVLPLFRGSGQWMVQPAYPCIRLWSESVQALFGAPDTLPLLTPNWDKRYLELGDDEYRFQPAPLPLAAIYLLGDRSDDASAPRVEAVLPTTGFIELVANAYGPHLKDKADRAQEFELLRSVTTELPLRRVIPSSDLGRVSMLCEAILEDFRSLASSPASSSAAEQCECV